MYYKSPKKTFSGNDWDHFVRSLPDATNVIINGDLNCKNTSWNCSCTTSDGENLKNWSEMEGFSICSSALPSRGQENLDLFLVNRNVDVLGDKKKLESLAFPSDHNVIVMRCKLNAKPKMLPGRRVYDWKSAKFDEFAVMLDEEIEGAPIWEERSMEPQEIEEAAVFITSEFLCAMELCVKSYDCNPEYETNITGDTQILVTKLRDERSRLLQLKRRNGNGLQNREIHRLKNSIKLLAKIVKERVEIDRRESFKAKCQRIQPGPNLFKEIKRVSEHKRFNPVPEVMSVNGVESADRRIQANAMGETFERVHLNARDAMDGARRSQVNDEMERRFNNHEKFFEFSPEHPASIDCLSHHEDMFVKTADITEIVNGLNNKTSKGPDCVPNKMLKKWDQDSSKH